MPHRHPAGGGNAMRIIVIGAEGDIRGAVCDELSPRHEIIIVE